MKHIVAYINITTGRPICYMIDRFKFTLNPKEATEEVGWNGFHSTMNEILTHIYNGNDSGNMTEHEYYHIREDYFKGIKKKEVMPTMTTKDNEMIYMRKLKILTIYQKMKKG